MSSDCDRMREHVADLVSGTLSREDVQIVEQHLRQCPTCRSYADALRKEDLLLNEYFTDMSADMTARQQRVLSAVDRCRVPKQKNSAAIWRIIMRSKITKLATAATIIVAVLVGLHVVGPLGATVTFAQVVEPILNAKTVICDVIIGADDTNPAMHEIIVGSRIRRTMSNLPGLVMIIDLDGGQMLALDTAGKTGSYVSIEGQVKDRTQNYVDFLRQVIRQVQDGRVEKIGEKVIDGQKAIGFVGRGRNEEVTIWADPQTAHPLRIEAQIGQEFAFIMKNFEFDTPVDDALVSMELPAGYTEQEATSDLTDVTEQDFVEGLRVFAEVLEDGVFPEAIGTETTMKRLPEMVEKAQQKGVSEEEIGELGTRLGRAMIFHQILESQGQWHYVGAGVKLGDADKAVFWYQPKGSPTCRVIYGDLRVEDVAPEDLPK